MPRYLFHAETVNLHKGDRYVVYLPSGGWAQNYDLAGNLLDGKFRTAEIDRPLKDFYGPEDVVEEWVQIDCVKTGQTRKIKLTPRLDESTGTIVEAPGGVGQGPTGPQGPPGPPGEGLTARVVTFAVPSDRWVIDNPAGGYPDVVVTDQDGQVWDTDVSYTPTEIVISWAWPQTGLVRVY